MRNGVCNSSFNGAVFRVKIAFTHADKDQVTLNDRSRPMCTGVSVYEYETRGREMKRSTKTERYDRDNRRTEARAPRDPSHETSSRNARRLFHMYDGICAKHRRNEQQAFFDVQSRYSRTTQRSFNIRPSTNMRLYFFYVHTCRESLMRHSYRYANDIATNLRKRASERTSDISPGGIHTLGAISRF